MGRSWGAAGAAGVGAGFGFNGNAPQRLELKRIDLCGFTGTAEEKRKQISVPVF